MVHFPLVSSWPPTSDRAPPIPSNHLAGLRSLGLLQVLGHANNHICLAIVLGLSAGRETQSVNRKVWGDWMTHCIFIVLSRCSAREKAPTPQSLDSSPLLYMTRTSHTLVTHTAQPHTSLPIDPPLRRMQRGWRRTEGRRLLGPCRWGPCDIMGGEHGTFEGTGRGGARKVWIRCIFVCIQGMGHGREEMAPPLPSTNLPCSPLLPTHLITRWLPGIPLACIQISPGFAT